MPALRGVIALALWLVMSAHGWSQVTVTRGPYLQRASTNGIVIRWRTDVVTGSWVFFGGAWGTEPFRRCTRHRACRDHHPPRTGHQVFYAIGDEAASARAPTRAFLLHRRPSAARSSAHLGAGRFRHGRRRHRRAECARRVSQLALAAYDDVWLMLGDNAYSWHRCGIPAGGVRHISQSAAQHRALAHLRQSRFMPTAASPTSTSFASAKCRSGRPHVGTENYYSFDHANIHFITSTRRVPAFARRRCSCGSSRISRLRKVDHRLLAPPAIHEGLARSRLRDRTRGDARACCRSSRRAAWTSCCQDIAIARALLFARWPLRRVRHAHA